MRRKTQKRRRQTPRRSEFQRDRILAGPVTGTTSQNCVPVDVLVDDVQLAGGQFTWVGRRCTDAPAIGERLQVQQSNQAFR